MKADKSLKTILELLTEFPTLALERIEQGTHYKLFLDTPCGKRLLVVSRSASDFRAIRNNRSILRKWTNETSANVNDGR